ncbi:MAG TPA: helix-turn-helix transcriptional regulator [Bacteroidia bacterium]|nr:helix-turn-helix transcriptional regulator [Bacteroidia bacterium]
MNLIKTILKDQGRSQVWLAKKVGKSFVVIGNYCNNKTQPSLKTLKLIAGALEVDITALLTSTKEEERLQEAAE